MKINEIGIVLIDHDIAALEVAVHEDIAWNRKQIVCQTLKISFEFGLGKVYVSEFEEVVFEVIQVPEDAFAVKSRYGIANGPIHVLCAFHLDMCELANGFAEHRDFVVGPLAGFAAGFDVVEE